MPFKLENIDRAIEWTLRDAFIEAGLWPDERTFIANNDKPGLNAAILAMSPRVDVFGVGNFTDHEKLSANNIIIERTSISEGQIGFAYPFELVLQPNLTYSKIKSPQGTNDIVYKLRFVSFDVEMDRSINHKIIRALGRRNFIYGINSDLTNMSDGFTILHMGDPADISGIDFIERLYTFIVNDVVLEEEPNVVDDNIPPVIDITGILNPNKQGADILYPDGGNDISNIRFGVVDLFIQYVEALPVWNKLEIARMYARESQALALKNIISHGPDAVNSGCSFSPYKGFYRSAVNEWIDTKYSPINSNRFGLTNYSYMVFVTEAPGAGIMELFGLVDNDNTVSIFMRGNNSIGIEVKSNSNTLLSDVNLRVKSNTLYTINRRDRFKMEVFEGADIIMTLVQEPTFIPNGNIFDLNISDEDGLAIGTSVLGGLAFSAAGPGLNGSDIKQMNTAIRLYLTKIGLLTS